MCRHLHKLSRDGELWKRLCFDNCHIAIAQRLKNINSRTPIPIPEPRVFELQRAITRTITTSNFTRKDGHLRKQSRSGTSNKRWTRSLISWDPSYPSENVNWYDEYISRHAVLSTSWIQQPTESLAHSSVRNEIQGLGFKKTGVDGIVVAPLDDGSICLWNIGFNDDLSKGKNGRILVRSKPGILSASKLIPAARQNIVATPECVSVDRLQNKAYIAVGADLNEIDLETLQVISRERYSSDIFALSDTSYPIPLTVGTNLDLSIHDIRLHHNSKTGSEKSDRTEPFSPLLTGPMVYYNPHLTTEQDNPASQLPSFQPLSILHLPTPDGLHDAQNGFIYVTGRSRNIMAYDRRTFPKLHSTMHSGAHLCSLVSAPASSPTPTIIACGEYKGKGSLEFYPADTQSPSLPPFRNRVSASSSKLLSAIPHGTRIVFSDSNGMLKWVERDGSTLVRKWNVGDSHPRPDAPPPPQGLFSVPVPAPAPAPHRSEDVARKLLPTGDGARDELLLWTGDRVGVVGFRTEPRFVLGEEGGGEEGEAALFAERMRRALERQADEVRFVRGLGLGG